MQLNETYLVSAVRTAVGKSGRGTLQQARPEYMGAEVVKAAIERAGANPERIDDVIIGCAFPEGPQGMNMGRAIAIKAGLPETVPGLTVNRFCSSGLQTIAQGFNRITLGQADCIVAGGSESMSAVPMGGFYFAPDPALAQDTPDFYASMGITAENVADQYGISRADQDAFAFRSHQRALDAIDSGRFADEIVPLHVEGVVYHDGSTVEMKTVFDTDEGPRRDTSIEALARLRPVFKKGGSVTAGNSSQTSDGAAAAVLMSKRMVEETGAEPMARMLGFGVAGVPARIMGIGPVEAIPKAVAQAGLKLSDIGLVELNEAFAAQALAVVRELGLNEDLVNVNGGAIALGHPLGCTGAKLTATLLYEMQRRGVRYGLCTMCIGGGMGAAAVFENLKM
ncbi:MAG: thiolase family protein [Bacteroidota bacterium]